VDPCTTARVKVQGTHLVGCCLAIKLISRTFIYLTVAGFAFQAPATSAPNLKQTVDQPADTIYCPTFINLDEMTTEITDVLTVKQSKALLSLRNIRPLQNVSRPSKEAQQKARLLNAEGLEMLRRSQPIAAKLAFRGAVQSDPTEAQYFNNLSYVETHDGNLSDAEKHAYITLALDPMRTATWGDLGVILAMKGNDEIAVNSFVLRVLVAQDRALAMKYLRQLAKNAKEQSVRKASQQALSKLK
jgi:Flp pilus assembly protein TadD